MKNSCKLSELVEIELLYSDNESDCYAAIHNTSGKQVFLIEFKLSNISFEYQQELLAKSSQHIQCDIKNVAKLYNLIETEKSLFLITEKPQNGCLIGFIKKYGPASEEVACRWFRQLLNAVSYYNNCFPNNLNSINFSQIYLDKNNEVVFCPFIKQCSEVCDYHEQITFAPEIFLNKIPKSIALVWSLGVILYTICSSKPPFKPDRFGQLSSVIINGTVYLPMGFSQNLSDIIQRMLEKDPKNRINFYGLFEHPWMLSSQQMNVHAERRIRKNFYLSSDQKENDSSISSRMSFREIRQKSLSLPERLTKLFHIIN